MEFEDKGKKGRRGGLTYLYMHTSLEDDMEHAMLLLCCLGIEKVDGIHVPRFASR